MKTWIALLALLSGFWPGQAAKPNDNDPSTWTWNNPDSVPGVEHGVLKSESMKVEVGYNVYLPPGYKDSQDRCPVAYFLHGMGGSEKSDAGFSGIVHQAIVEKKIPPMIYVFPNGGRAGTSTGPRGRRASKR